LTAGSSKKKFSNLNVTIAIDLESNNQHLTY